MALFDYRWLNGRRVHGVGELGAAARTALLLLMSGSLAACYQGTSADGGSDTDSGTVGATDASDSMGGTADESGSGESGETPPDDVDLVPESQARRMTPAELNNTLRDLLGEQTQPSNQWLAEPDYAPYDNDVARQVPSKALIESLEVLAQDVGNRFIDDAARRDAFMPCTPSGADDEACFRQFIEQFGRLALRRALSPVEVDAYAALQEYSMETNQFVETDFYTGVSLVIQAVIQDPEFLYRLEVGVPTTVPGVFKLTDHELAARISFLLWGSTPDDELLAEAEAGMLTDADNRRATVERLLTDDRAKEQLNRYHSMWLGYRTLPHNAELAGAFSDETAALINRVVFEDRAPYREMFTTTETYIDDFLAEHYGLPSPGATAAWVPYGDSGRAGILGHGSVLAAFSKFTDTSPTQRGIFIRDRLMCLEVPQAPPEIDTDNVPGDPSDPASCKEDRYLAHQAIASCAACHALFEPIGLGLENYDIAGVFRTTDNGKPDCSISGQGELPGVGPFSGPGELSARLVESGLVEPCLTRQYLEFAYGRPLKASEEPQVEAALATFEAQGFDFAGFIGEHVADEVFGFRKEPEQ